MDGGAVYYAYTQAENLDSTLELRSDLPVFATYDFNVNPGSHIEVGQYDQRNDRFAFRHEIHSPRLKTEEATQNLCDLLLRDGSFNHPSLEVYGDPSGNAEKTVASESDYQI